MKLLTRIAITLLFVFTAGQTLAASEVNTLDKEGLLSSYEETGIAIRGYDTVAYFTQGKPVEGKPEHSIDWRGATWLFSTQEHAELFDAEPEKYAPQYGGYCAYGVAQGYLVKIEPDQWSIVDNKLYLNYDRGVQKKWVKDIPGFITKANDQFSALLK